MMPDELGTGLVSRYSPSLKLRDTRSRSRFLPMISIALIIFKAFSRSARVEQLPCHIFVNVNINPVDPSFRT